MPSNLLKVEHFFVHKSNGHQSDQFVCAPGGAEAIVEDFVVSSNLRLDNRVDVCIIGGDLDEIIGQIKAVNLINLFKSNGQAYAWLEAVWRSRGDFLRVC